MRLGLVGAGGVRDCFSPLSQISWYACLPAFGVRCGATASAQLLHLACGPGRAAGPGRQMTLRFTSPQPRAWSRSASLIAGDRRLQVRLQHAVELEALPRGDAQRAVGVLARRCRPSRGTGPRSASRPGACSRIMNMYALPTPAFDAVLAGVAVFLLVAAVELDEALVRRRSGVDGRVGELLGERPAEEPALDLVPLDRRQLRFVGSRKTSSRSCRIGCAGQDLKAGIDRPVFCTRS